MKKIWITEEDIKFPGIVLEDNDDFLVVLQYDNVWRKKTVLKHCATPRESCDGLENHMVRLRQTVLSPNIKFTLPV